MNFEPPPSPDIRDVPPPGGEKGQDSTEQSKLLFDSVMDGPGFSTPADKSAPVKRNTPVEPDLQRRDSSQVQQPSGGVSAIGEKVRPEPRGERTSNQPGEVMNRPPEALKTAPQENLTTRPGNRTPDQLQAQSRLQIGGDQQVPAQPVRTDQQQPLKTDQQQPVRIDQQQPARIEQQTGRQTAAEPNVTRTIGDTVRNEPPQQTRTTEYKPTSEVRTGATSQPETRQTPPVIRSGIEVQRSLGGEQTTRVQSDKFAVNSDLPTSRGAQPQLREQAEPGHSNTTSTGQRNTGDRQDGSPGNDRNPNQRPGNDARAFSDAGLPERRSGNGVPPADRSGSERGSDRSGVERGSDGGIDRRTDRGNDKGPAPGGLDPRNPDALKGLDNATRGQGANERNDPTGIRREFGEGRIAEPGDGRGRSEMSGDKRGTAEPRMEHGDGRIADASGSKSGPRMDPADGRIADVRGQDSGRIDSKTGDGIKNPADAGRAGADGTRSDAGPRVAGGSSGSDTPGNTRLPPTSNDGSAFTGGKSEGGFQGSSRGIRAEGGGDIPPIFPPGVIPEVKGFKDLINKADGGRGGELGNKQTVQPGKGGEGQIGKGGDVQDTRGTAGDGTGKIADGRGVDPAGRVDGRTGDPTGKGGDGRVEAGGKPGDAFAPGEKGAVSSNQDGGPRVRVDSDGRLVAQGDGKGGGQSEPRNPGGGEKIASVGDKAGGGGTGSGGGTGGGGGGSGTGGSGIEGRRGDIQKFDPTQPDVRIGLDGSRGTGAGNAGRDSKSETPGIREDSKGRKQEQGGKQEPTGKEGRGDGQTSRPGEVPGLIPPNVLTPLGEAAGGLKEAANRIFGDKQGPISDPSISLPGKHTTHLPEAARAQGDTRVPADPTSRSVDGRIPADPTSRSVDGRIPADPTSRSVDGRVPADPTSRSVDGRIPADPTQKPGDNKNIADASGRPVADASGRLVVDASCRPVVDSTGRPADPRVIDGSIRGVDGTVQQPVKGSIEPLGKSTQHPHGPPPEKDELPEVELVDGDEDGAPGLAQELAAGVKFKGQQLRGKAALDANEDEEEGTESGVTALQDQEDSQYVYIVKDGDTLRSIASDVIGDVATLPLLFAKNEDIIRREAMIIPGTMEFSLLPGTLLRLPTPREIEEFKSGNIA